MKQIVIDFNNYLIRIYRFRQIKKISITHSNKTSEYDYISLCDYFEYEQVLYPKIKEDSLLQSVDQIIVKSDILGIVSIVLVKENQLVKKDDVLLCVSAMKSENEILAPISGFIKKIYVKEGETIDQNSNLVEIINEDL